MEKILDPGEPLRDWPVEGTVGYEFLNDVCALFVDPAGEAPLTDLWVEISGDDRRFAEHAFEAKLEQARTTFAPEVERLLRDAPSRVTGLERALASFPVYRTYVEPWSGRVEAADRAAIAEAGLPGSMARVLELETPGWDAFVTRFQQTTPPVMAKGVEDTAFYRYARLLALERRRRRPVAVLAVAWTPSTAPTPSARSASRATCSSPRPTTPSAPATCAPGSARWRGWRTSSRRTRGRWLNACRSLTSGGAPTAVEQHFIFQTLLGVWPISEERLAQYLEKAMREAKQHTTWVAVDEAHEAAVQRFARALLTHRDFLRDFVPFQARVAEAGDRAALGQLLLKLTVPGVPDIYQGDELLVPVAGRSRQPPRGRLGRAPRRAGGPAAQARPDPARARAARRAPGGVRGRLRTAAAPARTRSPSCAAARWSRACCCAASRSTLTLPAGDWRDVLGDRDVAGSLTLDGIAPAASGVAAAAGVLLGVELAVERAHEGEAVGAVLRVDGEGDRQRERAVAGVDLGAGVAQGEARRRAASAPAPGATSASSSPPMRARQSPVRTTAEVWAASSRRTRSPVVWPKRSLICLK